MKKLFFVLYACLCVGLWSCSNDDEPTVPNEKQDVVVSFEDKLTEANTAFAPTEGENTMTGIRLHRLQTVNR